MPIALLPGERPPPLRKRKPVVPPTESRVARGTGVRPRVRSQSLALLEAGQVPTRKVRTLAEIRTVAAGQRSEAEKSRLRAAVAATALNAGATFVRQGLTEAGVRRAAKPTLSEEQFERLRPLGSYRMYERFVARKREVPVGVLRREAQPIQGGKFKELLAQRRETLIASLPKRGAARGLAGGTIPVVFYWDEALGKMPLSRLQVVVPILQAAYEYLGTPYSYGSAAGRSYFGDRPVAFDCSGFTSWLYKTKAGIEIGTYTGTQRYAGRHVNVEDGEALKAGDLVFFHSDYGHEGLYLGDGYFIHAPKTGDVVKISSLNGYYEQNFVEARRIIG